MAVALSIQKMEDFNTTTDEGRQNKKVTLVQMNGRIGFLSNDEFSGRTNFSVKVYGVVKNTDGCLLGAMFQVDRSDSLNESR